MSLNSFINQSLDAGFLKEDSENSGEMMRDSVLKRGSGGLNGTDLNSQLSVIQTHMRYISPETSPVGFQGTYISGST